MWRDQITLSYYMYWRNKAIMLAPQMDQITLLIMLAPQIWHGHSYLFLLARQSSFVTPLISTTMRALNQNLFSHCLLYAIISNNLLGFDLMKTQHMCCMWCKPTLVQWCFLLAVILVFSLAFLATTNVKGLVKSRSLLAAARKPPVQIYLHWQLV